MDKRIHHYSIYSGRKPAGVGNEIFNYSKVQIANQVLPGVLHGPKTRKGTHELPKELMLTQGNFYNLRIFLARASNKLLIIDQTLYYETAKNIGDWDYSKVFFKLVEINPGKSHFLHSSKMSGGYLSIRSFRNSLCSMIMTGDLIRGGRVLVALHIRGSVMTTKKFSLFRKPDINPATIKNTFGEFNKETPTSFYLDAIDELANFHKTKSALFKIVTNLNPSHPKIMVIVEKLEDLSLDYTLVNGTQMDSVREIAESDLIIPSISSFSLLAIFLSQSRFIWPSSNLYEHKGFLSIWGFERYQNDNGPTERNIIRALNSGDINSNSLRGLPFPLISKVNFESLLKSNVFEFPDYLDFIYYGVVPADLRESQRIDSSE